MNQNPSPSSLPSSTPQKQPGSRKLLKHHLLSSQQPSQPPIKRRLASVTEAKGLFLPSKKKEKLPESLTVNHSHPKNLITSDSSIQHFDIPVTAIPSEPLNLHQHPPSNVSSRPSSSSSKQLQAQRQQSGSDILFNLPPYANIHSSAVARNQSPNQPRPRIPANHPTNPGFQNMETQQTGPATCDEEPVTWQDCQLEATLQSLQKEEEAAEAAGQADQRRNAAHRGPVRPCANTSFHGADTPFHVCAGCRERGVQLLRESQPELLVTHVHPLCTECYRGWRAGMASGQHRPGRQNWHWVCICGASWKCFGCRVSELETAKAKSEAEKEMRRGPVASEIIRGRFLVNPRGMVFLRMGLLCWCGKQLQGTEKIYKCSGCDGVVVDRRP